MKVCLVSRTSTLLLTDDRDCQSDHPVMNSRYLLYEAQNAYYYGLPENLAIASVTSTPAKLLGLGHRVGFVKEGG